MFPGPLDLGHSWGNGEQGERVYLLSPRMMPHPFTAQLLPDKKLNLAHCGSCLWHPNIMCNPLVFFSPQIVKQPPYAYISSSSALTTLCSIVYTPFLRFSLVQIFLTFHEPPKPLTDPPFSKQMDPTQGKKALKTYFLLYFE